MKRLWIITALLLVLLLGGITVWRLLPQPPRNVSDLYTECAMQDGVRAGYIENFRFDDSTLVDVTTVEALDSTGWEWMQQRFDLPPIDSLRSDNAVGDGPVMYTARLEDGNDFLFLSYATRSLCVVRVDNDRQFESIFRYHLQLLKK